MIGWRERLYALRDALDAAEVERRRELAELLEQWPEHRSVIAPAIDVEPATVDEVHMRLIQVMRAAPFVYAPAPRQLQ